MAGFDTYMDRLDMDFWRSLCLREGRRRTYRRGEYFARRGETTRYMGYVMSGYFKYTVTDSDGNEHISGFSFAGTFVGDYLSATNRQPCMTHIVAVTDVEVLLCRCEVLSHALGADGALHQTLADSLFRQIYGWYLDMHRLSPKERYLALLRRCPEILQSVTLKEIASYLNITPTYLSRIRREITFGGRQEKS